MYNKLCWCLGLSLIGPGLFVGTACDSGDGSSGGQSQAGTFSGSGASTGGSGVSGGASAGGSTTSGAGTSTAGSTAGGSGGAGGAGGSAGSSASGATSGGGGAGGVGTGGASGGGGAGGSTGGGGSGGGGGAGGGSAAAMLSDAQILAVLDTLNLGEVTEAQAAEPRLMEDDVAEFAREMIQEHGAARQQVTATASTLSLQPAANPEQMRLKTESDARVMAIMNATMAMVDDVYVAGQVTAHTNALALLTELQAAADAQPLKDLIGMQRQDVQEHLTEAMMLP